MQLDREFIEKSKHDVLGIRFSIGEWVFQPLNIVFEQFRHPIPMHRHSDGCYELHYIPYGKGTAIINGTIYPLEKGSLYMTGPEIDHEQQIDAADPMAEYCIFLYVSKQKTDTSHLSQDADIARLFIDTRLWIGKDQENLLPLMQILFQELTEQRTGYRLCVEAMIRECVVRMIRNYERGAERRIPVSLSRLPAQGSSLLMDECFLYEYNSITLEELSRRLSLSIRQTERLIQDQYHQTFRQKKAAARMHAATTMLVSTTLSLSQIAERLGFSSVEHFSTAFRKYYQISPGKYRRQCMSQTAAYTHP